jgi:site-specific recombinase XerD
MPAYLNVRFSFLCRTTRTNKDGESALVLRVILNKERRDLFTGLYCEKEQWNGKVGRLHRLNKQANNVNDNLDHIVRTAYEAFNALKYSGLDFTIDELVSKLKGEGEKPELLMDYLEHEKENLRKRRCVDITPATYDKYRRSATHVQQFLLTEYKIKNYPLTRIDVTFLERYFQYLKGTKGISHNVAVKYLTFFKTVLMPAIRSGVLKSDPFREIRFRKKPVPKGFLTNEELSLLKKAELSPDLDRVRNIFLFACYTGLAYCDIRGLSRVHMIKGNDENFHIQKSRQKTGQESIIPLLPAAIAILQKYSPTTDFRDFRWKVSSNQKMNQRLKTIGEKAGIEKQLHMHLARHTFATTVTLSNGIPIETVSRMLGHASITQTQHYAKIIATKIKDDMSRIKALYQ